MTLQYIPLRLAPDLVERLDGIAAKQTKSRAQVMRDGLQFFAQRHAIISEAEFRRLLSDEFIFLALDTIIQTQHGDVYRDLLDEAARRARDLRG
jgi:predicted DNA-binding protein